jgi:hypothetical protein
VGWGGGHFYDLLYIAAYGTCDFTFHLLFLAFDTLAPAPSLLRPVSFFLLTLAMEGERSPILDVVGEEAEVSRPEVSVTGSSSEDTSSGGSENGANVEGEESGAVNPRESVRSYDFGALTVTVGRIRQLEVLGYFVEGSTCELGEEVVPDPVDDEAVVFEEFFAAGLWMLPQLTLTDILVKFRVQLHQLTLNAFAQLSKYFWAVISFGGEPSNDGFAKRYELHYQSKKVDVDGVEKFQQFGILNLHAR